MEGDSTTTRIRLPGNDRTSRESQRNLLQWFVVFNMLTIVVGLVQPFLVLQVSIPAEARFVVELR